MVRKFNHLYLALARSHPSDNQSGSHAPPTEYIVDFIPVQMSLVNHSLSVRLVGSRTRIDLGRRRSQAHGTPHVFHILLIRKKVYDRVRGGRIKLRCVSAHHPHHMACKIYYRHLESQAYPQERDPLPPPPPHP